MGDGIQRKFALIVNGDAQEERHFENVDRAIKTLKVEDSQYQIVVASSRNPSVTVNAYLSPNQANLKSLIAGFQGKIDDDDLLVVYVTGHGGAGKQGEGCADLPDGCLSNQVLRDELKTLVYGKRMIVMDDCYSGGAIPLFSDGKTMIVTAGSPGEAVSCQNFSPFFWDPKAPDLDQDGRVTVAERYRHALKNGKPLTFTHYFSPVPSLSFSGMETKTPPFKEEVVKVTNGEELKKELQRLEPDQLALVMFSADWCGPCHAYLPVFQKLAKSYGGQYLMIQAEGIKGSEKDWHEYEIRRVPSLTFIDSRGGRQTVPLEFNENPKEFLIKFPILSLSDEQKIDYLGKNSDKDFHNDRLIKELNQRIHDPDPKARERIPFLVMLPIDDKIPALLAYLSPLLKDPSPRVRARAALALGGLKSQAKTAAFHLFPLLEDKDPSVEMEAISALLKIGGLPQKTQREEPSRFNVGKYTIVSWRIGPPSLELLQEKITKLLAHPDPFIRREATEALILTFMLSEKDKDRRLKEAEIYLRLLNDPALENRVHGVVASLFKIAIHRMSSKVEKHPNKENENYLIKRIAAKADQDPALTYEMATLLTAFGSSHLSDVLMEVFEKINHLPMEVIEKIKEARDSPCADPETKERIQLLLNRLEPKIKRQTLGFAVFGGFDNQGLQAGLQAFYGYQWSDRWEWQLKAAVGRVEAPAPISWDRRVDFYSGPVLHWNSFFAPGFGVDPYLFAQAGFFHLMEEKKSGVSLTAGMGLRYSLTPRLNLEAVGQGIVDFSLSGKVSGGGRFPLGLSYRF